jgi:peroxiredoxin
MKRLLALSLFACAVATAPAALAELKAGSKAPDFTAQATLAGKEFTFKLSDALKKGPVVVYFYPKAFTQGCTLEAHAFAEATPEFAKYKATVIGVSADDIATLHKFSVSECGGKFAVAADADTSIMKAYDSVLVRPGAPASANAIAARNSFVINQKGEVVYSYAAMDPSQHVANTMAAVKKIAGAKS